MKKIVLLFIVFGIKLMYAQNVFPANGNVGIGNTAPSEKLHVFGSIKFAVNQNANDAGYYGFLESFHAPNTGVLSFVGAGGAGKVIGAEAYGTDTAIYSDKTEKMRILSNGNVGIGKSNPLYTLDVNGATRILSTVLTSSNSPFLNSTVMFSQTGFNNIFGVDGTWTSKYFGMKTNGDFVIIGGNIGIGITNPQNKLDVNGTIHSKEVKVDMLGWSDFVFKKEYNLPTLEEVEKHIRENGHLENIPSEKEVLQNGINLGEMNAKLLQKIEEMTLYVIEQNKKIIDLETRLNKVETNSK